MKIAKLAVALAVVAVQAPAMAGAIPVKLFKNPNCFCCDLYARHLEQNGFKVQLVNTTDMDSVKQKYGIPDRLDGCHTAVVDGYIVEGLVPAKFVQKMLEERPKIKGIALPGMPVGAPGMDGQKTKALEVFTLEQGPAAASAAPRVFGSF